MRTRTSLSFLLLVLPAAAHAQNLYTKKDLAFAQVAAGGAYETVLNVTNRGSETYRGVLSLFTRTGLAWSPLVNGTLTTNGTSDIAINKGTTATYRITGGGQTEAGFAIIRAANQEQYSFLEGTLTYYVRSGGILVDSVGVQPSNELYLTVIPFDDFSRLAIALVNANTSEAPVKLTVFSDTNIPVASLIKRLSPREHMAVYLWQLFGSLQQMTSGRLEVQSDPPIFGTILTDTNGQLSSLPFLPAVKAYTFTGTLAGLSYTGEISLWFDGIFVQGFLRVSTFGGVPVPSPDSLPLTGSLVDGVLQVTASGNPATEDQLLTYMIIRPFSPSQETLQASATAWWLSTDALAGKGTLTLTAIRSDPEI
jgi:hypothetical protein